MLLKKNIVIIMIKLLIIQTYLNIYLNYINLISFIFQIPLIFLL